MANILQISPNFNYACGVSKHVFLLLKELKRQGKHKLFFITNVGDSLIRLNKIGIEPTIMKFQKDSRNLFLFILFTLQLLLFCKRNRIVVIHTHHRAPELAAIIVGRILGIKTITTVHSFTVGLENLSYHSQKIISVSNAVKNHLMKEYKVDGNKIVVMYNFTEPKKEVEITHTKNIIEKYSSKKIFLFAGRICYDKGVDTLIDVFRIIANQGDDLILFLIGQWFLDYDKDNLPSNVTYIASENDINQYLEKSFCVIIPSRVDPFPFLMLESGLAGKPFIGGCTGGIEEFIEDGVDGLLVNPGDEKDLLEKIMLLVKDEKLRIKLAENLNKKVSKLPTAEEYISNLEKIYAE